MMHGQRNITLWQCSLFSKRKNPIIQILYLPGCLAVPINSDRWSSFCTTH